MEQAAAAYTLNTTLEWWKEYTTVPPMQHADVSRRKVIAYYANSSCSACDACPRVRIDSRSWPHVVLSHTLPALLAPGKHLTMHIQPSEEDWRLDVFEASHVDFSLDFHVVAWLHASSAPSIRVRVCVLRGSVKGAGWLNGVSDLNEDSCQAGATIHLISARDGGDKNAQVTRTVPLPRSAQGWTVVMSNQGVDSARLCRPENAAFDDGQPCIPELGQNKVNIRAYAQIKTVGSCCGAVGDTPAQVFENTRSLGEFSSHVESLGSADTCAGRSIQGGSWTCAPFVEARVSNRHALRRRVSRLPPRPCCCVFDTTESSGNHLGGAFRRGLLKGTTCSKSQRNGPRPVKLMRARLCV
jgi:hypothetical protein